MSLAVVFSGQGTQHPGMFPWLVRDELVQEMEHRLEVGDWRAALADASWAENNVCAQMLLTATSLAAWQQLRALGLPMPTAVAGYSVGELAAFCAAGVFEAPTALHLAWHRSLAMSQCGERNPGGLVAVSGLALAAAESLCTEFGLHVAIINGPDAFILGGTLPALANAKQAMDQAGAQSTALRVRVASHTPLMSDAAELFQLELANTSCQRPRCALFSDATGDLVSHPQDARHVLAEQLRVPVRWSECMEGLYARRVSCVLEVGPGHALARMWNGQYPDVPARSCDDFRSPRAVIDWVTAMTTF